MLGDEFIRRFEDEILEVFHHVAEIDEDPGLAFILQIDSLHQTGEIGIDTAAAAQRRDTRFVAAERHGLDTILSPALLARQRAHHPFGERASSRYGDGTPAQIGNGLDRALYRNDEREVVRPVGDRRDANGRYTFEPRPERDGSAEPDIGIARGE